MWDATIDLPAAPRCELTLVRLVEVTGARLRAAEGRRDVAGVSPLLHLRAVRGLFIPKPVAGSPAGGSGHLPEVF